MYLQPFDKLLSSAAPIIVADGAAQTCLNVAFDYQLAQSAAGVWQPPLVLSWGNYLKRSLEFDLLRGTLDAAPAFVLSGEQERAVWEAVIADDSRLDMRAPEQAAPLASAAWQLHHLWALDSIESSQYVSADVAAFRRWAAAYQQRTAALGVSDLPRVLDQRVAHPEPGEPLIAHGFSVTAPLLARWFDRHKAVPHDDERGRLADYRGHVFSDRAAELRAALSWAADTAHAAPGARVAVILDPLAANSALIERSCSDVFGRAGADDLTAADYYCPLDGAIAGAPVVRLALDVLELKPTPRWDILSAVIRHPLLPGAAQEASARACFDAELRGFERYELPLEFALSRLVEAGTCPRLEQILKRLLPLHRDLPRRQPLGAWLGHFDACLKVIGWPGNTDTTRRQGRQVTAFNAVCDRLNALDVVVAPVSRNEALSRLRRLVGEARLPARAPAKGIFIVRPSEALVIEPTHVWWLACESDALPPATRASPLLPLDVQRAAKLPGIDPRADLWHSRLLLETLAGQTAERHASYVSGDGELRFLPSPLLPVLADAQPASMTVNMPSGWSQAPARLVTLDSDPAPALVGQQSLRGGVGIFAAQAACPFRAFARHRLAASEVDEPIPGISARHKGIFVHRVLARVWDGLDDSAALAALDRQARRRLLQSAIGQELTPLPYETALERELLFVERERLLELLDRWLEFELERAPFRVVAREFKVVAEMGGLNFSTRIDRVDEVEDGQHVIIDYKTGKAARGDWLAPRMNEPQLPLYALTAPYAAISGIAFARVDRVKPTWISAPHDKDLPAWPELLDSWAEDLAVLAAEIRRGRADLDPKRGSQTCRICEQAPFCRRLEVVVDALIDDAPGDDND